jgi:predicted GNAT superfamily acetyltransferase
MNKDFNLQILKTPEDMAAVEELQRLVWEGGDLDVIPAHLLMAIASNGGLVIGAWKDDLLVGFVLSFPGLEEKSGEYTLKHASHELGVHPAFRNRGIGFALKRAQWQMVRHQNIEHITWTYDPLMSKNAYLNIARLGAICNRYHRNYYGNLRDGLNQGLPTDRFIVDWWLNSPRVNTRLGKRNRPRLDLAHYLAAEVPIVNPTPLDSSGLPVPPEIDRPAYMKILKNRHTNSKPGALILLEIPSDYQALRRSNLQLAMQWRDHTRFLFENAFAHDYLVTDFIYLSGTQPRSFYVLSKGDITLGGDH